MKKHFGTSKSTDFSAFWHCLVTLNFEFFEFSSFFDFKTWNDSERLGRKSRVLANPLWGSTPGAWWLAHHGISARPCISLPRWPLFRHQTTGRKRKALVGNYCPAGSYHDMANCAILGWIHTFWVDMLWRHHQWTDRKRKRLLGKTRTSWWLLLQEWTADIYSRCVRIRTVT